MYYSVRNTSFDVLIYSFIFNFCGVYIFILVTSKTSDVQYVVNERVKKPQAAQEK